MWRYLDAPSAVTWTLATRPDLLAAASFRRLGVRLRRVLEGPTKPDHVRSVRGCVSGPPRRRLPETRPPSSTRRRTSDRGPKLRKRKPGAGGSPRTDGRGPGTTTGGTNCHWVRPTAKASPSTRWANRAPARQPRRIGFSTTISGLRRLRIGGPVDGIDTDGAERRGRTAVRGSRERRVRHVNRSGRGTVFGIRARLVQPPG